MAVSFMMCVQESYTRWLSFSVTVLTDRSWQLAHIFWHPFPVFNGLGWDNCVRFIEVSTQKGSKNKTMIEKNYDNNWLLFPIIQSSLGICARNCELNAQQSMDCCTNNTHDMHTTKSLGQTSAEV